MKKNNNLLASGSIPVPGHASLEMALPMQHHRTPQFSKIFGQTAEGDKYLFQTKQDVLILAATGTAGDIL
jgi:aspartate aminotransferase-like enzyme